jgi:ATP-dependent RNA helicase DHX57
MGGIKNKDLKRAANKVFTYVQTFILAIKLNSRHSFPYWLPMCSPSPATTHFQLPFFSIHTCRSGGGGGSKGPSIIDKRNQELQCPHCQRIFKQPNRLQDHIKKQHSTITEADDDEDNKGDGSSTSTTTTSSTTTKATKDRSPTTTTTVSINTNSNTKKIMDLNSKAGYYTSKSPKMLLHEWCLKEKLPRPKYKTISVDGGSKFKCRIVLPHPKRPDKDTIMFLHDSLAADEEEEAMQRAAVMALHCLAGDRSMERVLPEGYVGQWRRHGEEAQKRGEAMKKAAKSQDIRAFAAKNAAKKKGPATVFLTEDKRQLLQDILADVRSESSSSFRNNNNMNNNGDEDLDVEEYRRALIDELVVLGFNEQDATDAVENNNCTSLSSALDLLCLSIPEERLPSEFAPGAAGKPVTVIRSSGLRGKAIENGHTTTDNNNEKEEEESIYAVNDEDGWALRYLVQYGYPSTWCRDVVEKIGSSKEEECVVEALCRLHKKLMTIGGDHDNEEEGDGEALVTDDIDDSEWLEEREALQAIYDDQISFPSPTHTIIKLTDNGDGDEKDTASSQLYFECILSSKTEPYPNCAPVIAVKVGAAKDDDTVCIPLITLATLTRRLSEMAEETLVGGPMIYELAQAAVDLLPECIDAPLSPFKLFGIEEEEEEEEEEVLFIEEDDIPAKHQHRPHQQNNQQRSYMHNKPYINTEAESQRLLQLANRLANNTTHQSNIGKTRLKLPAAFQKTEIISAVTSHQVVMIAGQTGCGKSTQVPQYILEDAIAKGQGGCCNIICTQPRRISAVGLATRVAQERGERVGDTVGYSVRLDSKQSAVKTRLLFCTTGILLRRLLSDPSLSGITHVVLDEVHERTIESDLLLLLLRNMLITGMNPGIKIVMMSATADAELFAGYFETKMVMTQQQQQQQQGSKTAVITIPGFTHPVQDLFLEDVLESTGFVVGKSSKWALKNNNNNSSKDSGHKESSGAGGDNSNKKSDDTSSSSNDTHYSDQTRKSLANIDETLVNYELIEQLVAYILKNNTHQGGSLVIFAPGADEISKICRILSTSTKLQQSAASSSLRILPLHGGLPPTQQSRVFDRPPPNVIKIVVSTNVAETSITIDDATVVIDTGRVKEMRFDSQRGIARLQEAWVSQASAQQRRGRAGRVRPGVCFRLFSRNKTWGKNMSRDSPPEVLRAPLHGLVLNIKGILGGDVDVAAVLAEMITPPPNVDQAQQSLSLIGALQPAPKYTLTPLGAHLAKMPTDAKIGKMLIFGAVLGCLDPILTIAAAQGFGRPVFWSPPDQRAEADEAKKKLLANVARSKSDHLAIVEVYNAWKAEIEKFGRRAGSEFCAKNYLSDQAMESIDAGRRQLIDILIDMGFVPPSYHHHKNNSGGDKSPSSTSHVDSYSSNYRVVKAALCSGLYPQLLRVEAPTAKYQKTLGGAFETDTDPSKMKFFDRERGRVFLHPASSNFSCGKFESGWLVYSEIVETGKVYVRETSMVPVYSVLLFGGDISVYHQEGLVKVDGWATFKAPARIAVLVRELRAEVTLLLAQKISNPGLDLSRSRVVDAMHHLLHSDGF